MIICEENSFLWTPGVDEFFEIDVNAYGLVFIIQKGKCDWSDEPMWMVLLTLKEKSVRSEEHTSELQSP